MQLTLFDGLATLRSSRLIGGTVRGYDPLIVSDDRAAISAMDAAMIATIAGER